MYCCIPDITEASPMNCQCRAFTHTLLSTKCWCVCVWASPQELESHLVPTGQRCILLQSGQHRSGTPLLLSTSVCGPDWMTPMMTQPFLWVDLLFQGHSTPTSPEISDGAQHGITMATAFQPACVNYCQNKSGHYIRVIIWYNRIYITD